MKEPLKASFHDIMHIVATIYGEARGEFHEGRVAVGWVIRNRVNNPGWWGKSIQGVCKKDKQFSCWNDDDPNSPKVKEIALTWQDTNVLDDILIQGCLKAALDAVKPYKPDPTKGANHYHAVGIKPHWAKGQEPTAVIGRHIFYKL